MTYIYDITYVYIYIYRMWPLTSTVTKKHERVITKGVVILAN